MINKLDKNQAGAPAFPFTAAQAEPFETHMLGDLIDKLKTSAGLVVGIAAAVALSRAMAN